MSSPTSKTSSQVALALGGSNITQVTDSNSASKKPKSVSFQTKPSEKKSKSKVVLSEPNSKQASMQAKVMVEKSVEESKLTSMSTKSKKHKSKRKNKSGKTSNHKQTSTSAEVKKKVSKPAAKKAAIPTKAAMKEFSKEKVLTVGVKAGKERKLVKKQAEVTDKAEVKKAKKHSKSKRKLNVERKTVDDKSDSKLARKPANAKPDANQASPLESDKSESKHLVEISSKLRRLPRYTSEQIQKELRYKLVQYRLAANPPPDSSIALNLVRDSEAFGFCIIASGRFESSHTWFALCSPKGDILVEDNLDFERVPGVSKLLKDAAIIKVPHKMFKPEVFGECLASALLGSGFSFRDIRSAKLDLWKSQSLCRDFELWKEKDWSKDLLRQLAQDLCSLTWTVLSNRQPFVSADNNVLPHVRLTLLGLKVLGETESPEGPLTSEWGVSILGSLAKEDSYYTHVEDLDLPNDHGDVLKDLASSTSPATNFWKKRDKLPTFRRKGIETSRYSSSQSCRFCAGQPACQPDECLDHEVCKYPLCRDTEEAHAILTCNTLLNLCNWCNRRGHLPEHHLEYTLAVLESYFLLFAKYGLKTSFLFLANDAKLGKFVNSTAWRYGLFPLAPYEFAKQPAMLGLKPPRVPEHSVTKSDGVSKKAEKRKSAATLKREVKQVKWSEAVKPMKAKPISLEFTNSPSSTNLLDEPMDTQSSVGVMIDDVAQAVSVMGLPTESLAHDQLTTEVMDGVEFGSISQKEFSALTSQSISPVVMPPKEIDG